RDGAPRSRALTQPCQRRLTDIEFEEGAMDERRVIDPAGMHDELCDLALDRASRTDAFCCWTHCVGGRVDAADGSLGDAELDRAGGAHWYGSMGGASVVVAASVERRGLTAAMTTGRPRRSTPTWSTASYAAGRAAGATAATERPGSTG